MYEFTIRCKNYLEHKKVAMQIVSSSVWQLINYKVEIITSHCRATMPFGNRDGQCRWHNVP